VNQQKKRSGRRRGGQKPKPVDMWRPVPQLADPQPIRPAPDPTALVRSLGDPPLPGQGAVAQHYLSAVLEESRKLATALAASADLLRWESDEDDS